MSLPFSHKYVELAVKEALKVTTLSRNMRLGCVIFKGKTLIAFGHNHANIEKDIPMRYLKWKGSLHAEMAAIFSAFEKRKTLQGANILVVRINSDGQFRLAKPCQYCDLAIKELTPIRKVWYSIPEYPYIMKEERKL